MPDFGITTNAVMSGTVVPSAGAGVKARIGVLYVRFGTAALYQKTGAGDTSWTLVDASAGAADTLATSVAVTAGGTTITGDFLTIGVTDFSTTGPNNFGGTTFVSTGSAAAPGLSFDAGDGFYWSGGKTHLAVAGAAAGAVASLGQAQTYTKAQGVASVALTDAATVATDASLANVFTVTLAGNRTLGNPTNLVAGFTYVWTVTQDATGTRTLAYGNLFKWPGGVAPVLSITAGAIDTISAVYNGTSLLAVCQKAYA